MVGLQRVEQIMGMPILVDVRDVCAEARDLDRVFDWFRWVDDVFSTYKRGSQISRIARSELARADAHPDVQAVLARCDELRAETHGYFDAEAGGSFDPSALVKGWAVDRAALLLDEAGVANYAVNAGGDIRVRGGALPDPHWRIGIQHPIRRDRVAAVVHATAGGIATSGAYARGEHVVDPHTGTAPQAGVLSVTVLGRELATADAYATAAFAMGPQGAHWTARLSGFEAMTIRTDGTVLKTPGFPTP